MALKSPSGQLTYLLLFIYHYHVARKITKVRTLIRKGPTSFQALSPLPRCWEKDKGSRGEGAWERGW